MTESKRALLIDDHALFARGMAMLIERELALAATIETRCEPALDRVASGETFVLAVLDLELPAMSGLEAVQRLRHLAPALPVVVVSSHQSDLARQSVLDRGACAFVSKAESPERLIAELRRALAGGARTGKAAPAAAVVAAPLTGRQQQVLLLLSAGKSNKLIARALDMSENTVRNHVAAILDRLAVANRHEAADAARRLGLLDPAP